MKRALALWGILISATLVNATVLVSVNGNDITSEEVNRVLMEGTQGRFDSLPTDKQSELRQRMIDGMIAQRLVFNDAQKSGVLTTKEFKSEYQAAAARLKMQIAVKVWEQRQFDAIKVNLKEKKAYYDANPDYFVDKEKVHARHILVKTSEEALSIIKSMKGLSGDRLKAEFIAQTKAKSMGLSAARGGDLGYFPRGQMAPSFNDAVFSMKEGTISSEPVPSQYGYHIIYLEDKMIARKMNFDEVKGFVEQRLKMDKFKMYIDKRMVLLRSKAHVTYVK